MSMSKENSTQLWNSVQDSKLPPPPSALLAIPYVLIFHPRRLHCLQQNQQHPPQPRHTTKEHPLASLRALLTHRILNTWILQSCANTSTSFYPKPRSSDCRIGTEHYLAIALPEPTGCYTRRTDIAWCAHPVSSAARGGDEGGCLCGWLDTFECFDDRRMND
jgi:hypothetical protein